MKKDAFSIIFFQLYKQKKLNKIPNCSLHETTIAV